MPGALLADLGARTISGIAVPYGPVGRINGRYYRFQPGWLQMAGPVWLVNDHDNSQRCGRLVELAEQSTGLFTVLRVDRGRLGDRMLARVAQGELGLSVYVEQPTLVPDPAPGVRLVVRALLAHISLTEDPAFKEVSCR